MVDFKKTRKEPVEEIQALRRAQEELRIKDNAIASSITAIAIAEFAGNLTYVNNSFLKMWGFDDKNEVLGKPAVEFWKRKEKALEIIEALRDGDSVITELVANRKDGSLFDVLCSAGVVTNETGTPICMLGSFMDITERKNTEEALRESEERYRAIFEQAADSIVLVDAETGELVEFNDRAHKNLGYTREEFKKLGIHDFEVLESAEEVRKHLDKIIRQGADVFQTKHRRKDGEVRDNLVSSKAISIGGRNLCHCIWRDITEQKRAEKVLRFSLNFLERANLKTSKVPLLEEFVREIQEFTECEAVGIRILDESGNIPYEAYAGFSKEFYESENSLSVKSDKCMCINIIKGQTDSKLPFYTEGGSFYINGMARFLATVSEEDKSQNRHLCNEFGYESVALVPIRLRNDLIGLIHVADSRKNMVPLYLVEMLEKITTQVTSAIQRVRAEEKLQEHTDQLEEKVKEQTRELCDRVKELNCLYSISNLLKNPNLSLHEIFQATVELIPVSWQYPAITCSRLTLKDEQFSTSNFRETAWKQTSDIILHGERIGSVEVCYLEEKPQRNEGPFSKEERNLINAVAEFLETITEFKLMEQHERKHREEIAHFARLSTIGEMSSALAHELNQPLCAIATHAEGALRMMKSGDWDSNELLEAMEEAGTQAERAGKIIRRIANLVRKKEPHRSGVSIGEIIGETINLIEYEARLKGITIKWVEPSENPPMLEIDRIQIQQVLVNLLHNSFEAMKNVDQSKRQISIEVSTDENDMVQVVVSDTGCGLSTESADKIFEPFFTTNSQGLGIGLSISRSIIEAHGGRIWTESNPAGGATFRFTLPM